MYYKLPLVCWRGYGNLPTCSITIPLAAEGQAWYCVDKFPHPRKQTTGNESIPCSNDVCHNRKHCRSFKTPDIAFIWPKSSYTLSVARSHRSGKESGRRPWSPLDRHCDFINDVSFLLYPTLMTSNVKYVFILHGYQPIRSEGQHRAWDKHVCLPIACWFVICEYLKFGLFSISN